MRFIHIILASTLFFSVAQARHARGFYNACATYTATCQSDSTVTAENSNPQAKQKALQVCVRAAATKDEDKGQQCLATLPKTDTPSGQKSPPPQN